MVCKLRQHFSIKNRKQLNEEGSAEKDQFQMVSCLVFKINPRQSSSFVRPTGNGFDIVLPSVQNLAHASFQINLILVS